MSEKDLIQKIRAVRLSPPRASSSLSLGIGDDAALFAPRRRYQTILTCDWFLEGSHFLRDKHPADSIGWKCLARAISDIAAMGGAPRCFLLSLAIPASHTGRWLDDFLGGLRRAARKFKCPLAGGDTTRHTEILLNVTVVGEIRSGRALLRSGAQPGDIIYVSGRLGEADFGLHLFRKGHDSQNDPSLKKHLYPEPRIALGGWLADHRLASALMDLSDGLSTDLPRLCAASNVGADIHAASIPTLRLPDPAGVKHPDRLRLALNGGDDYELLFTVRPAKSGSLPRAFQGIPITAIGKITQRRTITLISLTGQKQLLAAGGWDPFKRR